MFNFKYLIKTSHNARPQIEHEMTNVFNNVFDSGINQKINLFNWQNETFNHFNSASI